MPIAPLYEWDETDLTVEVRVKLPGVSRAKSDVSATDCMIKVNSVPYLLLIDLHGGVDDARSSATLTTEGVRFNLYKVSPGLWGRLDAVGDKELLTQRRNASIERAHARMEAARKERLERKQKEERAAVDRQIAVERAKRQEIERRKQHELHTERAELVAWQSSVAGSGQHHPAAPPAIAASLNHRGDDSDYDEDDVQGVAAGAGAKDAVMPDHPDYHGKGWSQSRSSVPSSKSNGRMAQEQDQQGQQQQDGDGGEEDEQGPSTPPLAPRTKHQAAVEEEEVFRPLPPPRLKLQPVKVVFTQLEMPNLPAREQREVELKDWKKKAAVDQKLLADSVDVSDRQPVFLKDKGDGLYKQGNYKGALHAYSRALDLDPAIPLLWANRAAAHLKLGDAGAAVADCSQALELLRARQQRCESGAADAAEVAAWRKQLVRVLVRRGAAHSDLDHVLEAVADYEEALRYEHDPAARQQLSSDLEELRAALQPADALALRQRGNARFLAGDAEGAVEAFALLLGLPQGAVQGGCCGSHLDSERLAAYSNRAAANLVLGRYQQSISDCSQGLALALAALYSGSIQQAVDPTGALAEETTACCPPTSHHTAMTAGCSPCPGHHTVDSDAAEPAPLSVTTTNRQPRNPRTSIATCSQAAHPASLPASSTAQGCQQTDSHSPHDSLQPPPTTEGGNLPQTPSAAPVDKQAKEPPTQSNGLLLSTVPTLPAPALALATPPPCAPTSLALLHAAVAAAAAATAGATAGTSVAEEVAEEALQAWVHHLGSVQQAAASTSQELGPGHQHGRGSQGSASLDSSGNAAGVLEGGQEQQQQPLAVASKGGDTQHDSSVVSGGNSPAGHVIVVSAASQEAAQASSCLSSLAACQANEGQVQDDRVGTGYQAAGQALVPGLSDSAVRSAVLSVARLLARRGAARGHLRIYWQAAQDHHAAAVLQAAAGQSEAAAQLWSDADKLRRMHGTDTGEELAQQAMVLVIVDEFRTSRVSSSVHACQPCELHLPRDRPADWVPPAGQVIQRLVRRAWSLRHAKYVRGAISYEGLEALPTVDTEYQQGYKRVNDRLPKCRQSLYRAAEYRRGIDGRARNNA
ncbi:hypothetical protein QJQ45_010595 [Haematococcus lacustris]|nr:hypothetical protein QJQ45_010595 [Haematococcus lacustris]